MQYTIKKDDVGLIFIYDKLQLESLQKALHLDLEFVGFAYIKGYKLYHYRKSIVAMREMEGKRRYGNNKVFGSVYKVPNFYYNALKLDAYYYCSQARTGSTSEHDLRQRQEGIAQLIHFDTIKQFVNHAYSPLSMIKVNLYTGNKHDKKLTKHIAYGRSRIVDGIDLPTYKLLLKHHNIA